MSRWLSTRVVIVFDNRVIDSKFLAEHGFSCLIELNSKRILFDTGGNIAKFFYNMGVLGIDPRTIDIIVISHNHWDHVSSLSALISLNPGAKVYLPTYTLKPLEIVPGVWSTGSAEALYKDQKILEQALLVDLDDGVVVITGCSHPGVEVFINMARNIFKDRKLKALIGGWHFIERKVSEIVNTLNRLRSLDIELYIPCHCIDNKSIELAKKILGEKLIYCGTGLKVEL